MGLRIDRELALNAFLMAVWRRRPQQEVLVHSDLNRPGFCKSYLILLDQNKRVSAEFIIIFRQYPDAI